MSMKASLPVSRQTADDDAVLSPFDQIRYAREIIRLEAAALEHVAANLGTTFSQAVECLFQCRANVIVTGMGKAGLIGQKIAATLASTGTRSHFLHPAEAFHGDLGRIHRDDVLLVLSQSGKTEEVTRLLVEKLLLAPTEHLKAVADQERVASYADALNHLFNLSDESSDMNAETPSRPARPAARSPRTR